MHSIILLGIAVAAVLILAVPLNADRGDPSPTPPDSEIVEGGKKKCTGCEGKRLGDILTPDDSSKDGIFRIVPTGSTPPIKPGECKDPGDVGKCGETEPGEGCTMNDRYTLIHMPQYKHNGDMDSLTWEIKYPKNGKTPAWSDGPNPLKKGEVILLQGNSGAKPEQWNCGETLEIIIRWTKNGIPRSRTRRLKCTPCEEEKN